MRILVCVKQVLDPESVIRPDDAGQWIDAGPSPRYQLNRFDEYALEEALRLKEAHDGARVDVLTVGPERAWPVLERSLGMGATRAIHILTGEDGYLCPSRTATGIAAVIREKEYDLVMTGAMSEDLMLGQTGPQAAALAGLPWTTGAVRIEVRPEEGKLTVEREAEGGRREALEIKTPALLAVQTGINQPRYPTLSGLLKAKKVKPDVYNLDDLAGPEPADEVTATRQPEKRRQVHILQGDANAKAAALAAWLRESGLAQ